MPASIAGEDRIERDHEDYRLVFHRNGKPSGRMPRLFLNTPEYEVARHLFMEDSIFLREAGESVEVERFVEFEGWQRVDKREFRERWS
jgi:hypothetical protein